MIQNPKSQLEKQIDDLRKKVGSGSGGGTGKFLDSGHTSVAHCDTTNNSSQGMYDSVDGYDNTLTGTSTISQSGFVSNGSNTVTGQHNRISNSEGLNVSGRRNTITSADSSVIAGTDNTLNHARHSFIGGTSTSASNTIEYTVSVSNGTSIDYASLCILACSGASLGYVYKSLLIGNVYGSSSNPAGSITGCAIVSEHATVISSITNCIMSGEHNIFSGADYSFITGFSNNGNNSQSSIISGQSNDVSGVANNVGGQDNDVSANNCGVVGNSHYVRSANILICGQGGTSVGSSTYYFVVGGGTSSARSNVLTVDTSGNVRAQGSITPGGADYAEYFEWLDGNPGNEDRRGMLVTLDGDKIVPAHGNEFIGIISANPSVVGNAADMHWHGKYKSDVFGQVLKDEAGKPIISDDYKKQQYIPRSERPEWGLVGLMGRLIVTDDGSCRVGASISARNGVATSCYTGNARVLRRLDENHVEILLR